MIEVQKNHIYAYGAIGESYDGEWFSAGLRRAAEYGDPIIHLSTNGGSVTEGAAMSAAIRDCSRPVTVRVEGMAASMGAILMLSADKIEAARNALIMIHAPSVSAVSGTKNDMVNIASLLDKVAESLKVELRARGIAEDTIEGWFDGADHWFTASEALDAGLIDEVINPVVTTQLRKPTSEEAAAGIYARIMAELDVKITHNKMIKNVIKTLGLPEDATEQQVIGAITHLQTMAADRDSIVATNITEMLDAAVQDGRLTATVRPTYENIGKTMGVDVLRATLGNLPKRASAMDFIHRAGPASTTKKFDDYTSKELFDMKQQNPEMYEQLLNEKYK